MSYDAPPPPPGPGGGWGAQPGPFGQPPQQNKKAMWSLVTAILGFFCCPIVLSAVGIILGQQAKNEIAASGGMQTGESLAKAGVILGIIGLVLNLIYIALILTGAITNPFTTQTAP